MSRSKLLVATAATIAAVGLAVPAALAATSLTVGGGWTTFVWFGGDGAPVVDAPFTFTSDGAAVVTITDAFCPGDVFRVSEGATVLGSTSPSSGATCAPGTFDPDAALSNPVYSSGRFAVGAGAHAIDVVASASPWGGGGAYVRVDVLTKEMCKNDGWRAIQPFENQGGCVSLVATQGRR
jgi:hypothetical protein